jgi:cytochrome d ubiquinol oxidase subunit II
MDVLPTIWFVAILLLWSGYLLLEGFDLGVGMHMILLARTRDQRRVMLNSIGPVWDGNEVWLVTAIAGTFAAFPDWYASLLSTLYIPMTITLLGLIFRAVGIEYRGKGASHRWAQFWEFAIGIGSFIIAFGVGVLLTVSTTGLPLDANGDVVGGAFAWLTPPAIVGGFAVVGFALVHAATFLGLKTEGTVRNSARRFVVRFAGIALLPFLAWIIYTQVNHGNPVTWALTVIAVICAIIGWRYAARGREGRAFLGILLFLLAGLAAIFSAVYPVVLPSTLNRAWDLTITNASSAPYTLMVMSIVTAFGLPLILLYQGWSYWVFRKRVSESHLPKTHVVMPASRP